MNKRSVCNELRKITFDTDLYGNIPVSLFGSFLLGKYGEQLSDDIIDEQHTNNYFIITLNQSAPVKREWLNYHFKETEGGRYSSYDGAINLFDIVMPKYKFLIGSYITDFYKPIYKEIITSDGSQLQKTLSTLKKENKEKYDKYISNCLSILDREINTICGDKKPVIIAVGGKTFNALIKFNYDKKYEIFKVLHYTPQACSFKKEEYKTWGLIPDLTKR